MTTDSKHYVIQSLRDALATDGRVNELNIRVTIAGGKVFIAGTVSTEERRRSVSDVAAEVLPDYEIHNETTVQTPSGPPEVEEIP